MTSPANDSGLTDDRCQPNEFSPAELDELFDVLADRRRRCALRSLNDAGGTASFDELVGDVARQTVTQPVDSDRRREIATSLYHVHLPKLESIGLVTEFDPKGDVRLAERVDDVPRALLE